MKEIGRARQEAAEWKVRHDKLGEEFRESNRFYSELESQAALAEEAKVLAVAQLDSLKEEIVYYRQQVEIYQRRLGLLPQERQGTSDKKPEPLHKGRQPFAVVAANIQAERTKQYWEQRAQAAHEGITGTTTSDSETVTDKEPT